MIKDSLYLTKRILEKNYVVCNTNLTMNTEKLKKFIGSANISNFKQIDAALHISELERLNLLNCFVDNFHLVQNAGIPIKPKACLWPPLILKMRYYEDLIASKGLVIQWDNFMGKYHSREYPQSYSKKVIENKKTQNMKAVMANDYLKDRSFSFSSQDFRIEHDGRVTRTDNRHIIGHICSGIRI